MARAMTFMTKYIITWVCIGITAITFILMTNSTQSNITCVDGTQVNDKALCPQCTMDTHCGPDKICRDDVCEAKPCISDNDCDSTTATCIFEKCAHTTGKIQ